jgi:hypothetical protein
LSGFGLVGRERGTQQDLGVARLLLDLVVALCQHDRAVRLAFDVEFEASGFLLVQAIATLRRGGKTLAQLRRPSGRARIVQRASGERQPQQQHVRALPPSQQRQHFGRALLAQEEIRIRAQQELVRHSQAQRLLEVGLGLGGALQPDRHFSEARAQPQRQLRRYGTSLRESGAQRLIRGAQLPGAGLHIRSASLRVQRVGHRHQPRAFGQSFVIVRLHHVDCAAPGGRLGRLPVEFPGFAQALQRAGEVVAVLLDQAANRPIAGVAGS